MSTHTFEALIATLILGLSETDGMPESHLWLPFQSEIDSMSFMMVLDHLKAKGLISSRNYFVELTPKGVDLAKAMILELEIANNAYLAEESCTETGLLAEAMD